MTKRGALVTGFVLIIFFICSTALIAQETHMLATKTLSRVMDPVIITGSELSGLVGKNFENIRVYSYKKGTFQTIPFQIDERNKKGEYCYLSGKKPVKDEDHKFDGNDELVFIIMDAGDRINPQTCLEGYNSILEVEITDPVNSQKGWVYVAYYVNNPPRKSDVDYCIYESVREGAEGGYDRLDTPWMMWYYPWGRSMPTEIVCKELGGGNGKNMIDTYKYRMGISFFFKAFKLRFNEDNIIPETDAYTDGQVRVVRKVRLYVKVGYGLRTPSLVMDYLYYPHWCDVPANLNIPVSPKYLCSELYIETGTDYNPTALECKMYNSENPNGVTVTGKMDSPEKLNWNTAWDKWRGITGSVGTYYTRSVISEEIIRTTGLKVWTGYRDDINYLGGAPERIPGEIGHLYQHLDCTNVKAGSFDAHWDFYFPPNFRYPEDVDTVMNIREHPVKVIARKI